MADPKKIIQLATSVPKMLEELSKVSAKTKSLSAAEREANLQRFMSMSQVREPLYHATPKDLKVLKPGGDDPTVSGKAIWTTTSKAHQPAQHNIGSMAGEYREGTNVMPLHGRAERPLMLDDKGMLDWAQTVFAGGSKEFPELMADKWLDEVRGAGYDSIILADPHGLGNPHEVIFFEPTQLKSALGNRGTYDISSPELNKKKGGSINLAEGTTEMLRRKLKEAGERRTARQDQMTHGPAYDPTERDKIRESVKQWPAAAMTWPLDMVDFGASALANVASTTSPRLSKFAAANPATPFAPSVRERINYGLYGTQPRDQSEMSDPDSTNQIYDFLNPLMMINPTGTVRGAGRVAAKGAKALGPNAAKIAEDYLMRTGQMLPVIKPKGGNWTAGSIDRSTNMLKTNSRLGQVDNYAPDDPNRIQVGALNDFVDKQLSRYIKNDMGAPEDPIRALAEKGDIHFTPRGGAVSAAEREANLQKFLEPSKAQMRLYHGTTATQGGKGNEALRAIKPSKEGALGSGVYLTPQTDRASLYTRPSLPDVGGNILPVHAQIRNPLILDGPSDRDPMIEALVKLGMDEGKASKMVENAYDRQGYIGKQVQSRAQAAGYDGLMQYHNGELSEVVPFSSNQVKSAIGNEGTYDISSPELNKKKGGAVTLGQGLDMHGTGEGLAPYGLRYGTPTAKANGYFGLLPAADGKVSSEISAESDVGEYPLMAPTLNKEELNLLLSGQRPTDAIYQKAEDWAKKRQDSGQSPFASGNDYRYPVPKRKGGSISQDAMQMAVWNKAIRKSGGGRMSAAEMALFLIKKGVKAVGNAVEAKGIPDLPPAVGFKASEVTKPQSTIASKALDPFIGERLALTPNVADRMVARPGRSREKGGPMFPRLSTVDPDYAGWVWANKGKGKSTQMIRMADENPGLIFTPQFGDPEMHRSNQVTFERLLRAFDRAKAEGKLTPELEAAYNKRLTSFYKDVEGGKPLFSPEFSIGDLRASEAEAMPFPARAAIAEVLGGKGLRDYGYKRQEAAQIIPYKRILENMTEPSLVDAPTGSVGPRLFTLNGERTNDPKIHSAYPEIVGGKDLGVQYGVAPRDVIAHEFVKKIEASKGRPPGHMDWDRNSVVMPIDREMIQRLQDAGFKKGGKVQKKAAGGMTSDDLVLEERKL